MAFQVHSPAFNEGSRIPERYTGDGDNLSPPLEWTDVPPGTRSFALVCEDPDAPSGTFRHWGVAGIPADQRELPEGFGNAPPRRCAFAKNDFGRAAYDGPAPPPGHGPHHYHFRLAALDAEGISAAAQESVVDFWGRVRPHILAEAQTVGVYER